MRTTLVVLAASLAFFSAPGIYAQPAPVLLRGRVVDADNDRPLRRSIVSLARGDLRVRPVLTDEDGRFSLELPDLFSVVVITKAGYASTVINRDWRAAASRELDIRMERGAVLSGRVIEKGVPAIGARVIARRENETSSTPPTYQAETDDLGEYRIGDLPAGRYDVTASSTPQIVRITPGFATDREAVQGIAFNRYPVFAGGSKRQVDVRVGQETSDVDFEVSGLQATVPPEASALLKKAESGPGAITGRVVTPSGQPVAGALVQVSGNRQVRLVLADANGRFDAGRFQDGEYRIETGKSGYLTPEFRGPSDSFTARVVQVNADARVHDVDVVLARGGAIAGAVFDGAGEPFQGVLVRAMRLREIAGRTVAAAAGWPRLTDEHGRYRIFGLPPGAYLIVASLNATEPALGGRRAQGFAPVYYPASSHAGSAQTVQVEFENGVTGVDLTFASSSTARVTGRALNAAGDPLPGRVALATSARSRGVVGEPRFARIERDGSFELADVPSGDYVLQALGERGPGVPPEFGTEYITVAEVDTPPVTIRTAVGATLEGRFVTEGRRLLPLRVQVLHAAPLDADRSPPDGRGPEGLAVHDDGRFYLTGLFGSMRLTYPAPAGWYLKSLTIAGVDVTDEAYDFGFGDEIISGAEIVLSDTGARIGGSAFDLSDRPATEFAVVAFSANRTHWFTGSRHIRWATAGPNGSFEVDGLPAGEYFVAALDALPPGDWQPDALEALVQRATRVTAREGQVYTIALRLNRR
jgi:hypothetical protein